MNVPATSTVGIDVTHAHYVDWGSILIGTAVATAISIVLFTFGTGIGLSMVSPYEGEGTSKTAYFIALGLWTLWVLISSFMAGGYITGRLRRRIGDGTPHEVEVRDGAHGVGVWAVGVVAAGLLVASGVSGALGGAVSIAAPAATVAAAKADQTTFTIDRLFRAVPAQPVAADPSAVTPSAPARDVSADRQEVSRLLTMGMIKGELNADNKTYVAQLIAANTGLSQADAERRVNEVLADVKSKADKARKLSILITFTFAAALLLAGAAAAWAATVGGKHRNEETDFSAFWRWN